VRESDRCREQHRNRQNAPKPHAASVCRPQSKVNRGLAPDNRRDRGANSLHLRLRDHAAEQYLLQVANQRRNELERLISDHKERDAYTENEKENLYKHHIFEFHGCFYHAHMCTRNSHPDLQHPLRRDKTYKQIYDDTKAREKAIRDYFESKNLKYELNIAWECEVNEQVSPNLLTYNKEMKEYFDDCHDTAPFNPRQCLYGGKNHAVFFKYI